jgi:hypothetical protein
MRDEGLLTGHFVPRFSANFRWPELNPELVCKLHAILHTYHEALPNVTSKPLSKLSFSSIIKI